MFSKELPNKKVSPYKRGLFISEVNYSKIVRMINEINIRH